MNMKANNKQILISRKDCKAKKQETIRERTNWTIVWFVFDDNDARNTTFTHLSLFFIF